MVQLVQTTPTTVKVCILLGQVRPRFNSEAPPKLHHSFVISLLEPLRPSVEHDHLGPEPGPQHLDL